MRRKTYSGSPGLSWCVLWSHESVSFHISKIAAYAALSHSHVLLQHCLIPDPAFIPMFAFTFFKLSPGVLSTSRKQTLSVRQLPLWASRVQSVISQSVEVFQSCKVSTVVSLFRLCNHMGWLAKVIAPPMSHWNRSDCEVSDRRAFI